MTIRSKPSRVLRLAAVALIALFITLGTSLNASAQGRGDDSMLPPSKSEGCSKKFNVSNSDTWVCVRMSGPKNVTENVPFKITLKFQARKKLKNVTVVIYNPKGGFLYKRKFKSLKRGTITRTVQAVIKPDTAGRSAGEGYSSYGVRSVGRGLNRDGLWLATWSGIAHKQV